VIGLGGLGSGIAYWLARRAGADVLGLEQFAIGHHRGASQDHSRIARLSYHTPGYVELAKGAFDAWARLESDSEQRLLVNTGGLDLWPEGAAIPMADYTSSLSARAVPFEILDAGEIHTRWPPFTLADDVAGLYQEAGGIAAAARCNAAHIDMARTLGAALRAGVRVTSLRENEGEVEVVTDEGTYRCRKAIVAADAWTNELLSPLGVTLPLTITQEQVTYFQAADLDAFSPERFPIWIWMDEPSFYGFPVFGEAATKAAQDVGGREVTARSRTFETDEAALERVVRFLETHIPGALGPVLYSKTCLYTMPPDRDFIIDSVPGHPDVLVAQGAAHGFKFASIIGRIVSELAIDGRTSHDISTFRMARPALTEPSPRRFLI
jgi:sarcosine oxidase